jgi:hypothetical protein
MFENKYRKYKQKYLRLKKFIGGSVSKLPDEITVEEYNNYLPSNLKNYYTRMQLGNNVYYVKSPILIRQEKIKNDPNVIINIEEYQNLPYDKYGYAWVANYEGNSSFPISYHKGHKLEYNNELPHDRNTNQLPHDRNTNQLQHDRNTNQLPIEHKSSKEKLKRINKRLFDIMYDPTVKISKEEYLKLPPGGYGYKWLLVRDYDRNVIYYVKR